MPPVRWNDEAEEIIGGDITAALAYVTPAGGAVVTPIASIGLHDRDAGTVSFTTSLGFGRKLDRIRREPRIALAYHAREHGFASSGRYVLVQGRARIVEEPDEAYLNGELQRQVVKFMGEPKGGLFWDRWLREYYADRVPVHVDVERVVSWPELECAGAPEVFGEALPAAPAPPQTAPKNGTGPRVDPAKAARKLSRLPHVLTGFVHADGYPMIVPAQVGGGSADGIALDVPAGVPAGGRRAGLMGHAYRSQLIGLDTAQHTGWLNAGESTTVYAPHTGGGFRAPANKTVLLLANGFLAKRGLKKARRAQAAAAASG